MKENFDNDLIDEKVDDYSETDNDNYHIECDMTDFSEFYAISDIIKNAQKERNNKESRQENVSDSADDISESKDDKGDEEKTVGEPYDQENAEKKENVLKNNLSSVSNASKQKLNGIKGKIKNSLDAETIKDMFFGIKDDQSFADSGEEKTEEEKDYENKQKNINDDQPVLFDKKRKKPLTADPEQDKKLFEFEYMITPNQAEDGYLLFYNEFIRPKNMKRTALFGIAAIICLAAAAINSKSYMAWLLLLICLSAIAIMWLNTINAKKQAGISSDDVKNDSYKLTFYNSRIMIEASELAGDRVYNYSPVMIRFEDIDLKVIDYDELYVLIFKKDYIYTIPKNAMTEQMNEIFKHQLSNILGDDYREYYVKDKKTTEKFDSEEKIH